MGSRDVAPVKAFRFGRLAPGRSRVVVDLDRRACPSRVVSKPISAESEASRLTIEIKPCDDAAFAAAAIAPDTSAIETEPSAPPAPPVIVLDPGHGGIDGGAHGIGGAVEKTLALAFAWS